MTPQQTRFWRLMERPPHLDTHTWRTSRGVVMAIGTMPIKQVINTLRMVERIAALTLDYPEDDPWTPDQWTQIRAHAAEWCPAYQTLRDRAAGHQTLPADEASRLAQFRRTLPEAWQARLRTRQKS